MSQPVISLAETASEIAACLDIRHNVFVIEQGISAHDEQDGLDEHCRHVLARVGGMPVGAARLRLLGDVAKVQRVAVRDTYRRRGVARQMMQFMIAHVQDEHLARCLHLSAQTDALALYFGLGFIAKGDVYLDVGIPHQDMELRL